MQLAYYGLSDKPFELSPDLKFLYLTPGYRIALEAVVRGITDRKGLILLIGEVGTGKTMLIYGVMDRLPQKVKTAFIFHSTYNFRELLEQIISELEEPMPTEGIDELKNKFLSYLEKLKGRGELLAVLIDEAQKLSEEVVRGLFSLFEAKSWVSETLQIVLVGQPELEGTFNAAFLRNHPKIKPPRITINPLSKKESLEYIEYRLRMAGRSSADIFSPPALSLIVEKAGGIPRLLNIICDNALFAGYKDSAQRIEANLIEKIIINLEGPDYKPKIKKKPPVHVTYPKLSFRLFVRDGLIVLFGFTLVIGIFVFRPELKEQLTSWSGEIKVLLSEAQNLVKKVQSDKEYQGNSGRIDLIPEGRPQKGEEKSLEGQAQAPSLSLTRKIQVKEGDYLSKLVANHYGKLNESLIDLVLNHNPSIKNIDLVLVDQQIRLPELNEETLIVPISDEHFSVHLGTFSSLKEADQFINQLTLNRKNITVKPKKVSRRQTWYRVEAGSFESKMEALQVIKNLREKRLLPFF
jgi:general secretion pathway protein A